MVGQFLTREYGDVPVEMHIGSQVMKTHTDSEGYYIFDESLQEPIIKQETQWIEAKTYAFLNDKKLNTPTRIMIAGEQSSHLIISDVDDTIMESYITSPLKLKTLYYTFTKSPLQRIPVPAMYRLIKALHKFSRGNNPVIYLSNSPWNIYDFIKSFISSHGYIDGPVMLRDYGSHLFFSKNTDSIHKDQMLEIFFDFFDNKKFILIGDSSEKDVLYYTQFADRYPDQVDLIIIHDVGHSGKKEIIDRILESSPHRILVDHDITRIHKKVKKLSLI